MSEKDIVNRLDKLIDVINSQSASTGGGGGGGVGNPYMRAGQRAGQSYGQGDSGVKAQANANKMMVLENSSNDLLKAIEKHSKGSEKASLEILAGSKILESTMDSIRNDQANGIKRYEKMPEQFKKIFESQGAIAGEHVKNMKTQSDILNLENQIRDMKEEQLDYMEQEEELTTQQFDRLRELNKEIPELTKAFAKTAKQMRRKGMFGDAVQAVASGGGAKGALESLAGSLSLGKGGIWGLIASKVVDIVGGTMGKYSDEIRAQMKSGFFMDFQAMTDATIKFGMSVTEGTAFLGRNKDMIYAMEGGLTEFNEVVGDGARRAIEFTGNLAEASKFTADNIRFVRGLGNSAIDTAKAVKNQEEMYRSSARAFGMTVDEFNQVRSTLIENESVQKGMLMLRNEEREGMALGIQKHFELNKVLGYTTEEATKVAGVFAEMAAKSPVERMKEGAKLSAMMGMAGMGGQTARMRDLINRAPTLKGGERKELSGMLRGMSNKWGGMMGAGAGGFNQFEQIMHHMGLDKFILTMESSTKEGRAVDGKILSESEAQHSENLKAFTGMASSLDSLRALSESSLGVLIGILSVSTLAAGFAGGAGDIASLIGRQFPGAAKMLGVESLSAVAGAFAGGSKMSATEVATGKISGHEKKLAKLELERKQASSRLSQNIAGAPASKRGDLAQSLNAKFLEEEEKRVKEENQIRAAIEKQTQVIEKASKVGHLTDKEVAKNTGDTADQAKQQAEENKRANKGYRLKYLRASGTAQSAS